MSSAAKWYILGDDAYDDGSCPFIEIAAGECGTPEFCSIAHVQPAFIDNTDFVLTDEVRDRARLIAASPEMYEALQRLVAWKDAVSHLAPELGGLLTAIYNAEAILSKLEGK